MAGALVTRAFIVRPFDSKEVSPGRNVDFDRIDRELISPALDRLKIYGRTTAEIVQQGEISIARIRRWHGRSGELAPNCPPSCTRSEGATQRHAG